MFCREINLMDELVTTVSLGFFREKRNTVQRKFLGDKINGPIYENDSDSISSENYKIRYNENCRK